MSFLPINKDEMRERGWNYVDFVVVTGDCYVDHPSFGTAIIARILEYNGFKVGIIARPDYSKTESFDVFGKPRYGYFVGSGVVDSMVSNYTVAKKKRTDDVYAPKNYPIKRPDRALSVYCLKIKELYPDSPIIIGGIEASLRRFAHYDYWDDAVAQSVLLDCDADLLVYGMGEHQTIEIANRLKKGEKISEITDVKGTCYKTDLINGLSGIRLDNFVNVASDKKAYAKSCKVSIENQDYVTGKRLFQKFESGFVVQNPPSLPLETSELDLVYEFPYERNYHPIYEKMGGVDAIKEVQFSITHNRGCFSACNFCALNYHQGRTVTSRSEDSVLREAEMLTQHPEFKGYIHDVGGPTANYRQRSCQKQIQQGLCKNKRCIGPNPCSNLDVDHSEYLSILRKMRKTPKIKKVFVRSGIRYDYLMLDKDKTFFEELVQHHISGHLKVAPEHCSALVLELMGKPYIKAYKDFAKEFYAITKKQNKEQYLIPYLMSSHPGSTLKSAVELALFLKEQNIRPQQVQDFYPTPGTVSTCIYYTGLDPFTMKEVYVPKTPHDKALQRALLQYFLPQNKELVMEALKKCSRNDLIGNSAHCLVKADQKDTNFKQNAKGKNAVSSLGQKSGKSGNNSNGRKYNSNKNNTLKGSKKKR